MRVVASYYSLMCQAFDSNDLRQGHFTTFNNASIYVSYNYSYKFKVNSSITNYVPGLFLYWYIYFYSLESLAH